MSAAPTAGEPRAEPVRSPWQLVLGRLRRNRTALAGGALLLFLYLAALCASVIAPYGISTTSDNYYQPPQRIRIRDAEGQWRMPFIYRYRQVSLSPPEFVTDQAVRYPVRFWIRGEPYRLWRLIPMQRHLFGVVDPATGRAGAVRLHLLGTDETGRDIFSRLVYGSQISLSIGLIGILISMSIGMLVGGISGYFGGFVDEFLMRFVELLMSLPGLYLILLLKAALDAESPLTRMLFHLEEGDRLSSGQVYLLIIVALSFVGWGGTARVIRGIVLSVRELDYVQAARAIGASRLRLIVRHLLPNTLTYVIVSATLSVPGYILGEVALSFLGVGIEEPTPSWGLMLRDAQLYAITSGSWWFFSPGFMIFITVFAFNMLGDGLRDALDPKARN